MSYLCIVLQHKTESKMELIASFQVDHTDLKPGIYISRQDNVGGEKVTTYDIRMTSPNHEPAMAPSAIHTLEHIVATYLRNDSEWKERVIYWGPMGCLTGNYLILKGEYPCTEIRDLMIRAFEHAASYTDQVPGTTAATCGNYLLHDLPMARWEAARYVKRLREEFVCEYPGIERPLDAGGNIFHDA